VPQPSPEQIQGARAALGAVRTGWTIPTSGPERGRALARMAKAIEGDFVTQIGALERAGWSGARSDPDLLSYIAGAWHGLVGDAIGRALDRLERTK